MKSLVIFVVIALIVGCGHWLIWGHDLRYDVYANDTFWYDEEYSRRGTIIISSIVGLVGGATALVVIALFRRVKRSHMERNHP